MKITTLDENLIYDIGHAFGYYQYGVEKGLVNIFSDREKTAAYIRGYARMALKAGFMHTTSERGEGFIAYKLPGEKSGIRAALPLLKSVFESMTLSEIVRFIKLAKNGGQSLSDKFDKEKKPYIFVGMVCVREKYQGQGYMRKVMRMAFDEGNRLGVPVILETDAKSKLDKYVHLGMELAGSRDFGEIGTLYDLIKYPDSKEKIK